MAETLLQKAQRLGINPAQKPRADIISQRKQEFETAQKEAERISGVSGQTEETLKEAMEIFGIFPTGRRIAAGIAPLTEKPEDLANIVEELAGGVSKERRMGATGKLLKDVGVPENIAEGIDIAIDLPLISLGLSKSIAGTLEKQAIKNTPELAKFLSKPLVEFVPEALKRVLKTDISTPIKEEAETLLEKGFRRGGELVEKAKTTLFGTAPEPKNVEQVIKQADEGLKPEIIRATAEQVTAQPSLTERWAGIRPDIKNRIAGKQAKLKEYFDVAHARNNFDTLPTPLEHGAKNVDTAVTKMESILNDTGSQIGNFRKKVSTYEAPVDKVRIIQKSFDNQLSKLNLEIKNGKLQQIPGTVKRIGSDSDIKVLSELYGEFLKVKQNPNLEKLIDLRNLFDSRINFEKAAREVSSSLDPVSREMRKEIANLAAEIVGKEEAGNLKKYSEFIDAYNELKSYTDRKAGAEFLLKQVLSERGRSPREVIQTIKELTGIDLMDDAVMASIATDLIGNVAQKGVFRQEVTKAGLDVGAALRGDPRGAVELMFNFLKKGLVNEEKQFLKAAK